MAIAALPMCCSKVPVAQEQSLRQQNQGFFFPKETLLAFCNFESWDIRNFWCSMIRCLITFKPFCYLPKIISFSTLSFCFVPLKWAVHFWCSNKDLQTLPLRISPEEVYKASYLGIRLSCYAVLTKAYFFLILSQLSPKAHRFSHCSGAAETKFLC